MDSELLCNFKTCRKPLNSQAWVLVKTCQKFNYSLHHVLIFCYDDGVSQFEKSFTCPACHTTLRGKFDIVKVDLNPSEQYKSMILAGQRPEVIFEICSRAIAFWTYQVHQEIMFQKYVSTKAQQNSTELEKHYQDALQRTKNELSNLKENQENTLKDLETFKKKNAELSEKLTERIRQNQKLQLLYEALKRKCISPGFFERQTIKEKFRSPSFMSTASDNIHPRYRKTTQVNKNTNYAEVEREFVLRPAHTPTENISMEPTMLNFPPKEQFDSQNRRNIPSKKSRTSLPPYKF